MEKTIINRRKALKQASLILGYSITGPALTGVMNGCSPKESLGWQPKILSENEVAIVDAASSRIIPTGDTPGASDAKVSRFIDEMVAEYYLPEDQQRFQSGIEELNTLSEEVVSKEFAKASLAEQDQVLNELVQRTKQQLSASGSDKQPFFFMLKELTILGFFTSEIGATQVLNYDDIPGGFQGCEPLDEIGGKTWAT